jgi:hypothetical protein
MVSSEICGKFVEVGLRNSPGDAQDFFPHRARLPCLEGGGTFPTTFGDSRAHGGSRTHNGGNYSEEYLCCPKVVNSCDSGFMAYLREYH